MHSLFPFLWFLWRIIVQKYINLTNLTRLTPNDVMVTISAIQRQYQRDNSHALSCSIAGKIELVENSSWNSGKLWMLMFAEITPFEKFGRAMTRIKCLIRRDQRTYIHETLYSAKRSRHSSQVLKLNKIVQSVSTLFTLTTKALFYLELLFLFIINQIITHKTHNQYNYFKNETV